MVKPIGNKVLVKEDVLKDEKQTSSGIVYGVESTEKTKTSKGEIISIGSDVMKVTENQRVYFESHAGYPVTFKGEDYVLIQESNILGVIEDE